MRQVMDLKTSQLMQNFENCVVDHIFPKSRQYGPSQKSIFNLTLLERDTNAAKGNMHPNDFIMKVCAPSHRHDAERLARTFMSHFINDMAYDCLTVNDIDGFIAARASFFVEHLFEKSLKYIVNDGDDA